MWEDMLVPPIPFPHPQLGRTIPRIWRGVCLSHSICSSSYFLRDDLFTFIPQTSAQFLWPSLFSELLISSASVRKDHLQNIARTSRNVDYSSLSLEEVD